MVSRNHPNCPNCGKPLKPIYADRGKNFVGDTFTGRYEKCDCNPDPQPAKKDEDEMEGELNFVSDIVRNKDFDLGFRTGYSTASANATPSPATSPEPGEKEDELWEAVAAIVTFDYPHGNIPHKKLLELKSKFSITRKTEVK